MAKVTEMTIKISTAGNLEDKITDVIYQAKEMSDYMGSRELSLAITKLEEAQMWIDKIVQE